MAQQPHDPFSPHDAVHDEAGTPAKRGARKPRKAARVKPTDVTPGKSTQMIVKATPTKTAPRKAAAKKTPASKTAARTPARRRGRKS